MTNDDIALAFDLFDRVREAEPAHRRLSLDRETGVSPAVRDYVVSLLEHDSPTGEFLGTPVAQTAAGLASLAARPPEQIGPYQVIRMLGWGGFGTVFLAQEPRTRRQVAVKLMRPVFSDAEFRRMEFEAEALGRLNHEGIARVYACGIDENLGGTLYIAMEFVDGVPIVQYAQDNRLSVRDRVELLTRLCHAVGHAHQNGILHRDLSPRNILVDATGTPKVLDFGLACASDRDAGASMLLTGPGNFLGTLRAMSPEHLSGNSRAIDARSDTFSLGLIAFEVLTGQHPYIGADGPIGTLMHQLLHAPMTRASSVVRELRGDLDSILAKSVEREPQRRYQSPSAFADDLERFLTRRPVTARPFGVLYIARKFAARNRAVATFIGIAGVVLALAAVFSGLSLRREMEAQNAAITALDAVVSRVLTPLAPRIGSLAERESLLESIGPEVERIGSRMPNDQRVMRIGARYLGASADARLGRGREAEAAPLRAAALRAYEQLWEAGDRSAELGHEYSIAIVKHGDMEKAAERPQAAFEQYGRALALDETLAATFPTNLPILSNLFWSCTRFEELALDHGIGDASAWRDRASRVVDQMLRLDADAWRSCEAAAHIQSRFAKTEIDPAKAIPHAVEAVRHAQRLVKCDPSVGHHHAQLMLHALHCANLSLDAGRADIGVWAIGVADSSAPFVAVDAGNPYVEYTYLYPLYGAHSAVTMSNGDLLAAIKWSRKAIDLLDRRIAGGWGSAEDLMNKGEHLTRLCRALWLNGDAEAFQIASRQLQGLADAIDHPQTAAAYKDQTSEWRSELARLGQGSAASP
jgi:tetratricopeptide (TPR) repeat protein